MKDKTIDKLINMMNDLIEEENNNHKNNKYEKKDDKKEKKHCNCKKCLKKKRKT